MNKRTWIILTLTSVVILASFIIYNNINNQTTTKEKGNKRERSSSPRRALLVNAIVLKPTKISDHFSTNSTLLPSEEVDLTFETSGKITEIYFTEGSFVQKGTLLAKIRDTPLQAQLQKAVAGQKLAESKAYRQKALLAQDAISQETYDEAVTQVETGRADIALLQARINETELRAPFDGVLGLREVSEGAYVSPTNRVTRLSKVSPLKIEFSIPERYTDIIKKGTSISFHISGDTVIHQATVYATDSKIDVETRTMLLRAFYPNTNQKIPPGRYASVSLQLVQEEKGMTVPTEAIIPEMGRQTVYLARNGQAEQVEIIPGLRTESVVQVLGGLQFGDTVLTTGILQLRQGLAIRIDNLK